MYIQDTWCPCWFFILERYGRCQFCSQTARHRDWTACRTYWVRNGHTPGQTKNKYSVFGRKEWWSITPGSMYVEYIYIWYMHVYGCAHVSHARIRRALVFVCFIQIQPGLALVHEKHAWKKWIQIDDKICHDYTWRNNCNMLRWSKTRDTQQDNPSTHESVMCKQT